MMRSLLLAALPLAALAAPVTNLNGVVSLPNNELGRTQPVVVDAGMLPDVGYVDSATNETLRAAMEYAERHGGTNTNDVRAIVGDEVAGLDASHFTNRAPYSVVDRIMQTNVTVTVDEVQTLRVVETNRVVWTSPAGGPRVTPDYLHEITLGSSYPEDAEWYYLNHLGALGGCSARRYGGTFERNYDWLYDQTAEFVTRIPSGENPDGSVRHASIAVCSVGTNLTEAMVREGRFSRFYRCLPGMALDGVNDCGVAGTINVVPKDGAPWETGAPSGARTLCAAGAVRWALDHASTAEEAATYVASHAYVPRRLLDLGYSVHFAFVDATSTWVVESANGQTTALLIPTDYFPEPVVLTNYRIWWCAPGSMGPSYNDPYGTGAERAELLREAVGGVPVNHITNAWFRNAYRSTGSGVARTFPWPTEFAGNVADFPGGDGHRMKWQEDASFLQPWARHHIPEGAPETLVRGDGTWQTLHTSVYDLPSRTLRICVQENPEWLEFRLAGGVQTVNGLSGDVVLGPAEVGARPADWVPSAEDIAGPVADATNALMDVLGPAIDGKLGMKPDGAASEDHKVLWGGADYLVAQGADIRLIGTSQRGGTAHPAGIEADGDVSARSVQDFSGNVLSNKADRSEVSGVLASYAAVSNMAVFAVTTNANGSLTVGRDATKPPPGAGSFAYGNLVSAEGVNSHAEGNKTRAAGGGSHAEGSETIAQGGGSHAEGGGSIARANYSHAEGEGSKVEPNTAVAAHAEGGETTASAPYAHAEGSLATASGNAAHAEGKRTTASGPASHAEGEFTVASGVDSHAAGMNSVASNYVSWAWNGATGVDYGSHGDGTFNLNPVGGMSGLYIGSTNLADIVTAMILATAAPRESVSAEAYPGALGGLTVHNKSSGAWADFTPEGVLLAGGTQTLAFPAMAAGESTTIATSNDIATLMPRMASPVASNLTMVAADGTLLDSGVCATNVASNTELERVDANVMTIYSYVAGTNGVVICVTNYSSGAYSPDYGKFTIREVRGTEETVVYDSRVEITNHLARFEADVIRNPTNGVAASISSVSNYVEEVKADKNWQKYQSDGQPAPASNSIFMVARDVYFMHGYGWARQALGDGEVFVMRGDGTTTDVLTDGTNGTFAISTYVGDTREYFGYRVNGYREIGVDTSTFSVDRDAKACYFAYDIILADGHPTVMYTPSLDYADRGPDGEIHWTAMNNPASGAPVAEAVAETGWSVSVDHDPSDFNRHAVTAVWTRAGDPPPKAFFRGTLGGGIEAVSNFETNMAIDPKAGIVAHDVRDSSVVYKIVPMVRFEEDGSTNFLWRILGPAEVLP